MLICVIHLVKDLEVHATHSGSPVRTGTAFFRVLICIFGIIAIGKSPGDLNDYEPPGFSCYKTVKPEMESPGQGTPCDPHAKFTFPDHLTQENKNATFARLTGKEVDTWRGSR